jgi:putative phosphoesterase
VQPLFLELAGVKIAMVHEPEPVEAFARSGLYQLVLYGHTHQQELKTVGDCVVLNPGEVCGWLTGRATIAIVELPALKVEILPL